MERAADALLRPDLDRPAGPVVDLVERLALPFASLSLGRLLGIADDEAIRLGRLTRQVSGAFDQFATARQHARTAAAGAELVDRLTAIISGQRGASDLLAGLAGSGTTADEQELIGSAVMLFAAGVDSPASMVGPGHAAAAAPSGSGGPAAPPARAGAAGGGRDPPLRAAGAAGGQGRGHPGRT